MSDKGDIYLIKFPYTDSSDVKVRPALLLVSDLGDNGIFLQISSKKSKNSAFSVDLEHIDLMSKSYIKVDHISTIHNSQIIKKIGKLDLEIINEVDRKLLKLLRLEK